MKAGPHPVGVDAPDVGAGRSVVCPLRADRAVNRGPSRRTPALSAIPSLIRTAHSRTQSGAVSPLSFSGSILSLPVTASRTPSGVAGAIGLRWPWTRRPLARIWLLWKGRQGWQGRCPGLTSAKLTPLIWCAQADYAR